MASGLLQIPAATEVTESSQVTVAHAVDPETMKIRL